MSASPRQSSSTTRVIAIAACMLLVAGATVPAAEANYVCGWCIPVAALVIAAGAIYNDYCNDHGDGGVCPGSDGGDGGDGGAGCSPETIALGGCHGGQGGEGGEGSGYGDDGEDGESGPDTGP